MLTRQDLRKKTIALLQAFCLEQKLNQAETDYLDSTIPAILCTLFCGKPATASFYSKYQQHTKRQTTFIFLLLLI